VANLAFGHLQAASLGPAAKQLGSPPAVNVSPPVPIRAFQFVSLANEAVGGGAVVKFHLSALAANRHA
jgi:hypothetical protein